jgi:peptide/nickel transport system permease protein
VLTVPALDLPEAVALDETRQSVWTTLKRLPIISSFILLAFIVLALGADVIAPHHPYETSLRARFRPPMWEEGGSWDHPLGTDHLGRDIMTRVIYGARVSLAAGLLTVLLAGFVGAAIGLLSGFYGGRIDAVLMRAADATLAFPIILFALILAVTMGPSFFNVITAIAIVLWARYARVIRGEVLSLKERDFVAQARITGCSALRIMTYHLFPNTLNTFIVLLTLQIGYVILVEASLSFLGAGIPSPTPAWGSMVAEGRDYITRAWWVSFFPGVAIMLIVLSLNLLGDWVRDRLDPKLRQI